MSVGANGERDVFLSFEKTRVEKANAKEKKKVQSFALDLRQKTQKQKTKTKGGGREMNQTPNAMRVGKRDTHCKKKRAGKNDKDALIQRWGQLGGRNSY